MLLGSAGIASAQIDRTGPTCGPNYTSYVSPRYNFYYARKPCAVSRKKTS